jgi:PAS domain S-box-containing protein
LELIKRVLRETGVPYQVSHAGSHEALLAALPQEPDVILTDYYMVGLSAKDVLRLVAERGIDCPVIVMSEILDDEAVVECMTLGARAYLLKDAMAQLPRTIEQVHQTRVLERQQRAVVGWLHRSNAMMRVACRVGRVGPWSVELPARQLIWSNEVRAIHRAPPDFAPSVEDAILFYAPEHRETIRSAFERCAVEGTPFDCELQIVTVEGSLLWVRAIGEAERDEQGAIRRVHGALQDISDRKRAAVETEELAARLTSTLESITDAFFTVDRDWRFTYVNREAERMLRRSREELLGRNLWEEFPGARGTPFENYYVQAMNESRSVAFEEFYPPLELWADVRAYPSPQGLAVYFRDVSQTHRVATALRESERRFRELAENVHDIFYKGDRMLYISPAYERIWGRTCEQLYAAPSSYLESVLPEDRLIAKQARQQTIAGEFVEVEYRVRRPDGEVRWIRDESYPIRDPRGVVERIVGTARDVTDCHRATEVLRDSEERFRLLVEGVKDYAILLLDPDGNVASWNVGAERLHGFSADEMLGQHFARLFSADDATGRLPARCLKEAAEGGRFHSDVQLMRNDGTTFWASIVVTALRNESGDLRGFSKITRDISEWKRVNETLLQQATLLDQASDAIIVQGLDETIRYWNQGAQRLYGWTAEEAVGKPASQVIPSEICEVATAMTVLREAGEWSGELEQLTKSGRPVIVHARWTLLRAAESVLIINSDVTEKKKTEAQFLRAQRMESIGTLAAGIAHDLNNLLAPIIMGVGLLQRTPFSDGDARILKSIEFSADRGKNLVRQILSFARGVEGAHVTLDASYLVHEVQYMIGDTFPKNIALEVRLESDIRLVAGDPTQLSQVLLNLCLNARDAMPRGGRLTISAKNTVVDAQYAAAVPDAEVGEYVAISVTDSGSGIPKHVIERVFDPFFTTKEVGKGTGLGLATALGITKAHGGFLTVHSEIGKGSVFTVNLPALTEGSLPEPERCSSAEMPHGRGESVLVVDDEAAIRTVTKTTLEQHGYHVLVAEDGIEAITLFIRHQGEIAALITDLVMPVMDGAALVAAVRRLTPDLPIIGASGASGDIDVSPFAKSGVSCVISKPFNARTLLSMLRGALDSIPSPHRGSCTTAFAE